jgi:hypothetical protein
MTPVNTSRKKRIIILSVLLLVGLNFCIVGGIVSWVIPGLERLGKSISQPKSGFNFEVRNVTEVSYSPPSEVFLSQARNFPKIDRETALQKKLIADQVISFWQDENFQALDQMAEHFRQKQPRLPNGNSTSWYFLNFLSQQCVNSINQQAFQNCETKLNRWIGALPNSPNGYAALTSYYTDWAWDARSDLYSDKVSSRQWELFYERLDKAWQTIEKANQQGLKAPELSLQKLRVLQGTNLDDAETQRLFQEAVAEAPDYLPLYSLMSTIVLPRWYGDDDDLRQLAEWSAANSKHKGDSDRLYAFIAYSTATYGGTSQEEFKEYGFSWPRIIKGYEAMARKGPMDSEKLSVLCWMAFAYHDRKTATDLLHILGDNTEEGIKIWGSRDYYIRMRDWLLTH